MNEKERIVRHTAAVNWMKRVYTLTEEIDEKAAINFLKLHCSAPIWDSWWMQNRFSKITEEEVLDTIAKEAEMLSISRER